MKYSKSNPPLVCMQTQSTCYRGTGTMNVLGVLWHCTGANNPTLKRYVQPSDNTPDRDKWLALLGKNTGRNDWNHIKIDAGLNAWIGQLADGTVTGIQTMPWDYRPWGCGSGGRGSCNWGWIQFEMCEDDLNGEEYFEAAYTEACEITAYLCALYDIDPLGYVNYEGIQVPTILCHNDSASLGLGTWHADVYNWVRDKYGKTMDDVRNDVASILSGVEPIPTPAPTPEPTPEPDTGTNTIQVGDVVRILPGSVYYKTDKVVPDWVLAKDWIVSSIDKNRVVLGKSVDGKNNINSPVRYDYLELVTDNTTGPDPKPEPGIEYLTYSEKVDMVCDLALSEVGYLEKLTNYQLYDKTANPGRGNFTKYAHEIDTLWPTFYNETVSGKDGCSVTVDWFFLHLFGKENAQKMLYYPERSGGADCKECADIFRARGKFFTVPQKGDKVMFGDYGAEGHTGLVVKVEGSMIYTVEGNVSVNGSPEGVWMKQYDLSDPSAYIPGYCRPNYGVAIIKGSTPEIPSTEPEQPGSGPDIEPVPEPTPIPEDAVSIVLNVLQKGSQGGLVVTLQELLKAKGYNPGYPDGIFGVNTYKAVYSFQKEHSLIADGIVGKDTWNRMLKG